MSCEQHQDKCIQILLHLLMGVWLYWGRAARWSELKGGFCQFLCNLDKSLKHNFEILRPTAAFTSKLLDSFKTPALSLLEDESLECLSCYLLVLSEVQWLPVPSAGGVLITRALSHGYYSTEEKSPWDKCKEPTPICPVHFCIHTS